MRDAEMQREHQKGFSQDRPNTWQKIKRCAWDRPQLLGCVIIFQCSSEDGCSENGYIQGKDSQKRLLSCRESVKGCMARMNFVERCRWMESARRADVVSLPFRAEFGEQLTPQILVGRCIILPRWLTGKFSVPSFDGSSIFYEGAVFYKPSEARLTATPATTVPKPLRFTSRTSNLFLNRLRLLGTATLLPSATEKLSQHKEGGATQTVLARVCHKVSLGKANDSSRLMVE
ncbi:uncharacterized protein LOC112540725 isoform X2 [Python bivittatus]|uniref:Uncharacterized protein LOC112540725 isoform X2 n=1 Tax=Python bivittatus TaxID=176946 RepID=A0A9F5IT11_PYTBI|nr:uncharacterized protein LOC112540725 isoform X2 [Python bivittatus]